MTNYQPAQTFHRNRTERHLSNSADIWTVKSDQDLVWTFVFTVEGQDFVVMPSGNILGILNEVPEDAKAAFDVVQAVQLW